MVHLIKNDKGRAIGWEMCPTNDEEQRIAGTIRDLQFFGIGDTAIEYNGLELIDPQIGKELGNIKRISWIQKKAMNNTLEDKIRELHTLCGHSLFIEYYSYTHSHMYKIINPFTDSKEEKLVICDMEDGFEKALDIAIFEIQKRKEEFFKK